MLKRLVLTLIIPALAFSSFIHAATAPSVSVYGVDSVKNSGAYFEARYKFQRKFSANDPIYPGKTDYVSKNIRVLKRGNPMKWVKGTALQAVVAAAVIGAGYTIDELTNQVMNPAKTEPDPKQVTGFYFTDGIGSELRSGATKEEAIRNWFAQYNITSGIHSISCNNWTDSGSQCSIYYYDPGSYRDTTQNHSPSIHSCNGSTTGVCAPLTVTVDPTPANNADVWNIINPVADANPDYLQDWVTDPAGNPYIYPEVQTAQQSIVDSAPVTGAAGLPNEVVVNDPLAGQGLDATGQPTGDSPTPEKTTDLPDDYAREDTLKKARDYLADLKNSLVDGNGVPQPDAAKDYLYTGDGFNQLKDGMNGISDPPSIGNLPNVPGYSSSCQTVSMTWKGKTVLFPDSGQCAKLNQAKDIIGYMLYILTAFGIAFTVLESNKGTS